MSEFTVRTRKFLNNPLLGRKQFVLDVIHPGMANVSKKDLAEKLRSMYKVQDVNCIQLFSFKTAFGGGRSSGFGLIYENLEKMKKFEPKYRLKRVGVGGEKKGPGRRAKKDTKNRMKKAGSHLLRNVMRRTFDILGANFSCHYIVKSDGAVITSMGGQHVCQDTKAPVRFENSNNARTILQMRLEGPMRGVMIIRDPFEMVASAYVYHHRGAEVGSPCAPSNVMSLGPNDGVPATAQSMWHVVEDMTQAYQVAGDDVLPVRYEDFTRSSLDFNATMDKIIHFLFEGEITEVQKLRILQSTQYEDKNGPYGLSKSLDIVEEIQTPEDRINHTSDDDDLRRARKAVPLIPSELRQSYAKSRKIMGYA